MTEGDLFERQFAAAVRAYAEGAPTEVDAAALVRSLAATRPRTGRLVHRPVWGLPGFGVAWALLLLALLLAGMIGVALAGGWPDLGRLLGVAPSPSRPAASVPAVIATALPSAPSAPFSPSPAPTATPTPTPAPAPTAAPSALPAGASSPPAPSPLPGPTSAPPYGADLAWSGVAQLPRFDPDHALTNATLGDVAAGGPGFVAVGSDWVDDERAVAVAWLSRDGRTWTERAVGTPGPTSLLASPALTSVTQGDGLLVAVGRVGIWRSLDGYGWELSQGPDELDGVPLRVAWGTDGFVVLGHGAGDTCDARVWVSRDGLAWLPVALPDAQGICPIDLAAGAAGYLAVGRDPLTGDTEVMVSPDGLTWWLAPAQAAFEGHGYPEGATWAGERWIAFGAFLPPGASARGVAVWTSPDGLTWQRTAYLRPAGSYACDPGSAHLQEVVPFGPGYVGVGRCTVSPEQVGVAWASADGSTWATVLGRVPPMLAVAADGTRLVTVGADWPDHAPVATVAVLAP